jgi:hypothetical protein
VIDGSKSAADYPSRVATIYCAAGKCKCGDGRLDPGEECDDGNRDDGVAARIRASSAAGSVTARWTATPARGYLQRRRLVPRRAPLDGTSCDDGNPCTTDDACSGGAPSADRPELR